MDYTSSNAFATDAGTGQRLHQQSAAVTTAVTDQDMNGLIWELLEVIKAGGIAPAAFDKTNPATYTQVARAIQSGKLFSAAAAGTADAISAVFTPDITVLRDGMALYVRGALANASTTPTFTPKAGTIAAKAIVKGAGAALAAGDIAGAGHWIELQYDLTLDKWVLLNPATGVTAASFASNAEAQAFAITNKAVSPSTLAQALKGANQSLSANGYQKLPGGLIVQWVSSGSLDQNSTSTITLPIAWPTGYLAGVANKRGVFIIGTTDASLLVQPNPTNPLTQVDTSIGANGGGSSHALPYTLIVIGY